MNQTLSNVLEFAGGAIMDIGQNVTLTYKETNNAFLDIGRQLTIRGATRDSSVFKNDVFLSLGTSDSQLFLENVEVTRIAFGKSDNALIGEMGVKANSRITTLVFEDMARVNIDQATELAVENDIGISNARLELLGGGTLKGNVFLENPKSKLVLNGNGGTVNKVVVTTDADLENGLISVEATKFTLNKFEIERNTVLDIKGNCTLMINDTLSVPKNATLTLKGAGTLDPEKNVVANGEIKLLNTEQQTQLIANDINLELGKPFQVGKLITNEGTHLTLNGNILLELNEGTTIGTLNLNSFTLTLASKETDLVIAGASEPVINLKSGRIYTNGADLTFAKEFIMDSDSTVIQSTGGVLAFNGGGNLTAGNLNLQNTEVRLGGDFTVASVVSIKTNYSTDLNICRYPQSSEADCKDVTMTIAQPLDFRNLLLNGKKLTLKSTETQSNLILTGSVALQSTDSIEVNSGVLDFVTNLTMTGGAISVSEEGKLALGKKADLTGGAITLAAESTLYLGNDVGFGASLTIENLTADQASIVELRGTVSISSTELRIGHLNLKEHTLTLKDGTLLSINQSLVMAKNNDEIVFKNATLRLEAGIEMTAGKILGGDAETTSATAKLLMAPDPSYNFSGKATLTLKNVEVNSTDNETAVTLIIKNSASDQTNLSLEGGKISNVWIDEGKGLFSTRDVPENPVNLKGFNYEDYGYDKHGFYMEKNKVETEKKPVVPKKYKDLQKIPDYKDWIVTEDQSDGELVLDVKLLSRPAGDVKIEFKVDKKTQDEIELLEYAMVFSPDNWNATQKQVVTGLEDDEFDPNVRVLVTASSTSEDSKYYNNKSEILNGESGIINEDNEEDHTPPKAIIGSKDQPHEYGTDINCVEQTNLVQVNEDSLVMLDGSSSYSDNSLIKDYVWEINGFALVTVQNPTSQNASFQTPEISEKHNDLTIKISLTVYDEQNASNIACLDFKVLKTEDCPKEGTHTGSYVKYPAQFGTKFVCEDQKIEFKGNGGSLILRILKWIV
ncbi:hypothetical protein WDW89_02615 [Deltaproteobacteria bacterium TL4]